MSSLLKAKIRQEILRRLKKQSKEIRLRKSSLIKKKLFLQPEFKKAKTVLFYLSKEGEVQTDLMIKEALKLGKKIALPVIKVDKKEIIPCLLQNPLKLQRGPYGIQEPREKESVSCKEIDLVIVPGVAFDRNNYRLGRGGGYYDKLLKKISPHIPSFGLAYRCQIVKSLPHTFHDEPVSKVLSA